MVYEKRLDGRRIAPELTLIKSGTFDDLPESYKSREVECQAPCLSNRELFQNPVYTSDYGLEINLSDYLRHLKRRPSYEQHDNFTRVISLPNVLIVMWLSSTMCSWVNVCHLRGVKETSRDSQLDSPDSHIPRDPVINLQLECYNLPWFQVLDSHIFLVTTEYKNGDTDPRWTLWYLEDELIKLFESTGERPQSVVCYDGLFRYFQGDEYHVFQIGLDGTIVRDTRESPVTAAD